MEATKNRIVLTKVSLLYSPVEDRIRMTGRIGENDALVLWLTLRVCQKLVKALTDYIEKATNVPAGSDRELVLSFQQSAAMVRKDPSEPVVADAGAQSALIERVDMSFRKESVLLSFFMPQGDIGQFSLSVQNARQWLGILRSQYLSAGWPMDIWPAWFAAPADKPSTVAQSRQMH